MRVAELNRSSNTLSLPIEILIAAIFVDTAENEPSRFAVPKLGLHRSPSTAPQVVDEARDEAGHLMCLVQDRGGSGWIYAKNLRRLRTVELGRLPRRSAELGS